ncbi:MAG: hypothetical protein HRU20_27795 [Pseudomonadales bacterium]|nr:hypothetical protein [Pseudomonadales bacterium]
MKIFFPHRVYKLTSQEFESPYTRWLGDGDKWIQVIFTQCTFSANHRFRINEKCLITLKDCVFIEGKAPSHERILII